MKQNIAFIIISYRPDKKILDALRLALFDWNVFVVDNTKNNRGYGGGANVGIGQALKKGAQWVVVLNQDLRLTPSAVQEFTSTIQKSAPAIIGPFAGSLDPKRWTTSIPAKQTDYISGSCIAIHRDVVERVGSFYEPYFLYYEEVDLCIRAKRAGYKLACIPIKGIEHDESVGLGRGSFLHQYYLARNHLLFVQRLAPIRVKLYELFRLPKTVWEHISKKEWGGLRGVYDYVFRRFGIL